MANAKIGIFGIGLDTYWGQFSGLLDQLKGYQSEIVERIGTFGTQVVDAGMVDNIDKAHCAAERFRQEGVDLVFVYISTYALSSTVLPVLQESKAFPVLLNIQPVAALDYEKFNALGDRGKMTGEWLAHCQACSAPEIASVCKRSGIPFGIVSGYLQEEETWQELEAWTKAAAVMHGMRNNKMGILGHYYGGMLDVYTDVTKQSAVFGTQVELLEMCELVDLRASVSESQVQQKIKEFAEHFEVVPECSAYEIDRTARTSVALDQLISKHQLGSMAYYYEGLGEYQNVVTSIIAGNTLLTSKGVPIAGECEVKNVQAMKIMSLLGAGGSFSEFYLMDFNDDIVMLGHDGPAHAQIAQGRVKLVPLPIYHGKPGSGLSIQMEVKNGPVTLLSVCESPQGVYLLVAEGASVEGPTLQIGNTNSRYRFSCGAKQFMNEWSAAGPSHHCAIGTGRHASEIEKLAKLLRIDCIRIC